MPKVAVDPVFRRPGSKFWQIRYTDHTKREVRVSSRTEVFDEAQALYQKLIEGGGQTLTDIAEKFFEHKEMSPKTRECYLTSFRAWVEIISNPRLEFIDHATIRLFISKRMGVVKESTIRNDLAFLSSLFRYAMMLENGPKLNPVKNFDKSALTPSKQRIRSLRPDQLRTLMSKITEPHRKLIVLFGLEAGLRKNEILNLKVYQVNLWRRRVTLRGEDVKTGRGRTVPLSRALIRALIAHFRADPALRENQSNFLIVNKDTGFPYKEIRPWWDNALRDAKIEDFTFHDTRHHFATTFVRSGGRLQSLARILGHTSVKMTEAYAHLNDVEAHREFHTVMRHIK